MEAGESKMVFSHGPMSRAHNAARRHALIRCESPAPSPGAPCTLAVAVDGEASIANLRLAYDLSGNEWMLRPVRFSGCRVMAAELATSAAREQGVQLPP